MITRIESTTGVAPEMTLANIHIRPALPTSADAAAFADLANMASHDVLADVVGPDYHRQAASIFLRDDVLFGYPFTHFADAANVTVGMLCAFSGEDKSRLNDETNRALEESASPSGRKVMAQIEPLLAFIDQVPLDSWYVQFLAVNPNARRKGIARKLLRVAEGCARDYGAKTLELDVETGNEAALKVYRGYGMHSITTSPTVHSEMQQRSIALHRMVKALDDTG